MRELGKAAYWENRGKSLVSPLTNLGQAFATDPLGTALSFLDSGNRLPQTRTVTTYALSLHMRVANRSGPIGAVHEVSHNQNIQISEEYDVARNSIGLPRELIPQNLTTRSLRLGRYDLYRSTMEQIMGQPFELLMLNKQIGPISMRLTWKYPDAAPWVDNLSGATASAADRKAQSFVYEFQGCYITGMGKTMNVGNVIVGSNADLIWHRVQRIN
jgi:hypothetical protein